MSGRDRQGGKLEDFPSKCDCSPDIPAQDKVGDGQRDEQPSQYLQVGQRPVQVIGQTDRRACKYDSAQGHEPQPKGDRAESDYFCDVEPADAVCGVDAVPDGAADKQRRGDVVTEGKSEKRGFRNPSPWKPDPEMDESQFVV